MQGIEPPRTGLMAAPVASLREVTSPEGQKDRPVQHLLARGTWPEARYVASALRTETVGGALLLGAAVVALIWANTPWQDAYIALRDFVVGPHALHLDLSLGTWAADGLLALFFLVAGIELKREFVAGDLPDRSEGGAADRGRGVRCRGARAALRG